MIAPGTQFDATPLPALHAVEEGALRIRHEPSADASRLRAAAVAVGRLPARALLLLITGYQRFVSPVLPVVTLGACACRFSPSCSQYAADAVRTHGALAGAALALRRLLKCTPLHPGGFDPVPPRRPRPTCHPVIR